MASEAIGTQTPTLAPTPAGDTRPTKYYFAYGSNLHLRQMKRRCPGSKFIGCARLSHYRWQINERGYANVVEAEGHWVDGLVYEIDEADESRLDINEGVSKNAYTKRYMTVLLNRAQSPLYRRPTAWIVDKGGPAKVRLLAEAEGQKESEHPQHWEQNVLVYVSLNYIVDSKPKEEYIKRINFGVNDAKALGVGDDYVTNCIRPFIPPNQRRPQAGARTAANPRGRGGGGRGGGRGGGAAGTGRTGGQGGTAAPEASGPVIRGASPTNENGKQPSQGVKRGASQRSAEPSPARKTQASSPQRATTPSPARRAQRSITPPPVWRAQAPPRPANPSPQRLPAVNRLVISDDRRRARSDVGAAPPLPPRPTRRMQSIPVIVIDDRHFITRLR
ncbi:hypothetical protein B0J13DRAFT_618124 [Dactylonectria estremocensis]|uniref:gamma-glutamylcyclotransferase n=1 Tax=Dactylonectria estremocensis TaxID=1079267 RepID=A0A9P9FDP1_9HYPO|nr:hypothetical protein B0J13DRAFT_618124 [Dactylonectria estremocensis]